jgi:protein SCO1/2
MSLRHAVSSGLFVALLALFASSAVAGTSPEDRPPSRWRAGYFPNVELKTHEGKTVRFYDDVIKDKVVAINFMFTSCNDVCPAETARLRQVQQMLGDRVGNDIFFYSITLDPEVDTPEVLAEYRERFKLGPGWTFLTGTEETIALVQKKLGLLIEDLEDPEDHSTTLIVGNEATGQWMKRTPYDNPHVLVGLLANTLHNWQVPNGDRPGYEMAPKLAKFTGGELLFRSRCNACHTIGQGDGVGPDLIGVADRRDPAWMVRWLSEPDVMIAEGDPIALEILAQYGDLRMPNLSLTDVDVRGVIEYLRKESTRISNERKVTASEPPSTGTTHSGLDAHAHADAH